MFDEMVRWLIDLVGKRYLATFLFILYFLLYFLCNSGQHGMNWSGLLAGWVSLLSLLLFAGLWLFGHLEFGPEFGLHLEGRFICMNKSFRH